MPFLQAKECSSTVFGQGEQAALGEHLKPERSCSGVKFAIDTHRGLPVLPFTHVLAFFNLVTLCLFNKNVASSSFLYIVSVSVVI